MTDDKFNSLFPKYMIEQTFLELSNRTTIESVLMAARYIENRLLPEETKTDHLLITFPDIELFETVIRWSFDQFSQVYRCPLDIAKKSMSIDTSFDILTFQKILDAKFRPRIILMSNERIRDMLEAIESEEQLRFLIIEDEPYVLEMIEPCISALHQLIVASLFEAWKKTRSVALGKGVFQKHLGQHILREISPEKVLEALSYYACGYEVKKEL